MGYSEIDIICFFQFLKDNNISLKESKIGGRDSISISTPENILITRISLTNNIDRFFVEEKIDKINKYYKNCLDSNIVISRCSI